MTQPLVLFLKLNSLTSCITKRDDDDNDDEDDELLGSLTLVKMMLVMRMVMVLTS